jgi:hypothetical protein
MPSISPAKAEEIMAVDANASATNLFIGFSIGCSLKAAGRQDCRAMSETAERL